jgi:hypothetical protein
MIRFARGRMEVDNRGSRSRGSANPTSDSRPIRGRVCAPARPGLSVSFSDRRKTV